MNLIINGETIDVGTEPRLLLWVLRDELGLTGTKFGCGAGICGACTVHVNGVATRSCITPLNQLNDSDKITTLEGISTVSESGEVVMHPVQQAFLDEQVPQCAWCMSGQMMTAAAFLAENSSPTEAEVVEAMDRNYCRCGCYVRIKSAVIRAADIMQDQTS